MLEDAEVAESVRIGSSVVAHLIKPSAYNPQADGQFDHLLCQVVAPFSQGEARSGSVDSENSSAFHLTGSPASSGPVYRLGPSCWVRLQRSGGNGGVAPTLSCSLSERDLLTMCQNNGSSSHTLVRALPSRAMARTSTVTIFAPYF
jgi:hypothetical protein